MAEGNPMGRTFDTEHVVAFLASVTGGGKLERVSVDGGLQGLHVDRNPVSRAEFDRWASDWLGDQGEPNTMEDAHDLAERAIGHAFRDGNVWPRAG